MKKSEKKWKKKKNLWDMELKEVGGLGKLMESWDEPKTPSSLWGE